MWWQLQPLGFLGAPAALDDPAQPVSHRLRRLEPWLDYAAELGATGLALGPLFMAGTHGYDTIDHFRIDPRLGDDADFDRLIGQAHERGLKVMLDGVFNHVGQGFRPFRDALHLGPSSSVAGWFDFRWAPVWTAGRPSFRTFEGHDLLVALNHRNPAVARYVTEVMVHWLDRGADAWRLDAAYATPPEFWATVLPGVREKHPEVYAVGEVIHGDYASIVKRSTMDSGTQYELWKAIWSSLNDRNFFELAAALERHNALLAHFLPLTFIGNHDVTRIASKLDTAELLPVAIALLFALPGDPCVYAGDEQAFTGVKEDRAGGDDAIRPEFPAGPGEFAPFGSDTFALHQRLAAFRCRHPGATSCETLGLTNTSMVLRINDFWLAMNIGDATVRLPVGRATTIGLSTPGQSAPTGGILALAAMSWALLT